MVGQTLGMMTQHLKHPAVRRIPAPALVHHAFKLGAQGFEPGEALLDLFQLSSGDGVGFMAGPLGLIAKVKQLPDRLKRKSLADAHAG